MRGPGAIVLVAAGAIAAAAGVCRRADAQALKSELVVGGLTRPVVVTHAPGDFGRLFIVEKAGLIKIFKNGALNATPFLDITSRVSGTSLELGLVGFCFHPNYQQNGVFYVGFNDLQNSGHNVIAECRVSANPDVADVASLSIVLHIPLSATTHRAGWMDLGHDGYLYALFGDGGPENDTQNHAQNLNLLQGKLLRLDVDGPDNVPMSADDDGFPADADKNYRIPPDNPFVGGGGLPEIWAYGLRNPWRGSVDRMTGDIWFADVGQSTREEVDFQPAGAPGGRNYGWRCTEGTFCPGNTGCTCNDQSLTPPIYEYPHSGADIRGISITGGHVYRGCAMPDLDGTYFFGDAWITGLYSLKQVGGAATAVTNRTTELRSSDGASNNVVSFGEDAYGEIYWCDYGGPAGGTATGRIFKIVPAAFVGPDCNNNGKRDACDILDGTSLDVNGNGVPDECDPALCPADLDGDGSVGASDLAILLGSWGIGGVADLDGSGTVGSPDLAILLGSWGACP